MQLVYFGDPKIAPEGIKNPTIEDKAHTLVSFKHLARRRPGAGQDDDSDEGEDVSG